MIDARELTAVQITKKLRRYLTCAFIFSLVINILTLAPSLYSLQVYDRILTSGSIDTLWMLTIIILAALAVLAILSSIRSLIFQQAAHKLDWTLSLDIFKHSISNACVHPTPLGSQMLREFTTMKNFLLSPALHSLLDLPWVVIYMVVLFAIHPLIGQTILVAAILLIILAAINHIITSAAIKASHEISTENLSYTETCTRNAEVAEAMGIKGHLIKHWQELNRDTILAQQTATQRSLGISTFTSFFRMTVQVGIMGLGAYLVIHKELTSGGIIASSILAGKALAPFDQSIAIWKNVLTSLHSYRQLKKMLALVPDREKCLPLPTPKGQVSAEHVVFKAPSSSKVILNDICFEIEAGEHIGIIGPSGAGKSTLAKLLVGIWKPTQGTVRLDQSNIYLWNRDHLGPSIGYMTQDAELFPGTISQNIARMDDEADPNLITAAAEATLSNTMILNLPKGYDTIIGRNNTSLSHGQKQRIALVRAFYKNPPLIVLDEPNTHMDEEGDKALAAALQHAKTHKLTVFLITHRPQTLLQMDKIMILQDGQLVACETKDVIWKKYFGNALT